MTENCIIKTPLGFAKIVGDNDGISEITILNSEEKERLKQKQLEEDRKKKAKYKVDEDQKMELIKLYFMDYFVD